MPQAGTTAFVIDVTGGMLITIIINVDLSFLYTRNVIKYVSCEYD